MQLTYFLIDHRMLNGANDSFLMGLFEQITTQVKGQGQHCNLLEENKLNFKNHAKYK